MTDIFTRLAALTTKDANGLLPCQHCNTLPMLNEYPSNKSFKCSWQVECKNIDCPLECCACSYTSREHAIKSWNESRPREAQPSSRSCRRRQRRLISRAEP